MVVLPWWVVVTNGDGGVDCSSAGDGLHSYMWFVVYEPSRALQFSNSACLYL